MVEGLSTHLGFFCRIYTTSNVIICTAEARGEYPPDSRVFESCSEIRHVEQVSQRLLHHQAGASHSVRSASRGDQRGPARKRDDSTCSLNVLVARRWPKRSWSTGRGSIFIASLSSRLDGFFDHLPKDFRQAIEIRSVGLLGAEYHQVLETHGDSHVYNNHNHWSYMPPLAEQQTRMQGFTAVFTVVRLLTPLKLSYEVAKKRAEPYTKIVGELPEMRRDTVELVRKAIAQDRRAYVLVNSRSEGNAPLTVQGLSELLRG